MDYFFYHIIDHLSYFSSEFLILCEFLVFSIILLLSFRFFGAMGIISFSVISFILGNLQVLREAQFFFQNPPIALGTVCFSMIFLATDMLIEHYGKKMAKLSVILSFTGQVLVMLIMIITLSYSPQSDNYYIELKKIFITSPRFLIASIIAYVSSQFFDIYLFDKIKKHYKGIKWLWLRSNLSTFLSGLLDNAIFSMLAWVIFAPISPNLSKLIFTYILGTYWFRIFINSWSTPIIYLSYKAKKKNLIFGIKEQELEKQDMER